MPQEQSQFSDSQISRRLSDRVRESDTCSTGSEIWREVATLNSLVHSHQRILENIITSFPVNDLNQPDYDGHRKATLEQIESAKILRGYKATAASKVIGAFAAFFAGALASGTLEGLRRILFP